MRILRQPFLIATDFLDMTQIRPAAVAGSFYPGNMQNLKELVDGLLADASTDETCPNAIIAPHAGYVYSGPIAASVYARLLNREKPIEKVVIIGPSHRVAFKGIAASSSDFFRTPLGDIEVDTDEIQEIVKLPSLGYLDEAHSDEHSLEVHLPFLQRVLPAFKLIPLVAGDASPVEVSRLLEQVWGGEETLIVISSDLSHYHPYNKARALDKVTSEKIQRLDTNLSGDEACGCRPINGLMHFARQRGYRIEEVDLRNSGDTSGDADRVVGYGSYVVVKDVVVKDVAVKDSVKKNVVPNEVNSEPNEPTLPLSHRQVLLQTARECIHSLVTTKQQIQINLQEFPPALKEERASFVTINLKGQLRGCIGSLIPHRPLIMDVANNALSAASKDPRFKPLSLVEYPDVNIHLSVLSIPEELSFSDREHLLELIRPGIDGLIIEESGHRATYLPSVWSQLPDRINFLRELRKKAGLNPDSWSTNTRVFNYTTEEFC